MTDGVRVVHQHSPRLWDYRELVRRLTVRSVRARYSHSVLGVYWALVNPLLTAALISIVFGPMLQVIRSDGPFILFVLPGLILWNLLANSVTDSALSITNYSMLLGKVRFPREVLPLTAVLARLVDLGFSLLVLGLFMAFFRTGLTPVALWALPITAIVLVLALGISLAVSALNVMYRDVGHVVSLALLLWFYLCPIFYSVEQVAEPYRTWLRLNPMSSIIESFRRSVVLGQPPEFDHLGVAAALSLIALVLGWWVFRRYQGKFAEIL
jgi:ABC-type polysaccharide/polyol phosphate export permease